MLEDFFVGLPLFVNILFVLAALYVVTRSSHYLVDGAIHIATEFNISPLIIGATVVAMGTSSAELAVNLAAVLGGGDTAVVAGNILGSNLVNFGIELGISALIAGAILVPQEVLEKDIPLYLAATGLLTALVFDNRIGRFEALIMLLLFGLALNLIIQYAKAKHQSGILLVEVSEVETISHPTARELTRTQALLALFGGLAVLILSSRVLVLNCGAAAQVLNIPKFIVGLVIIGPGTSLPEIASSIQAARRGHANLVLGTAFGSNLFNLLFGLGLPALIQPLEIKDTAILSFIFMNAINISLVALILTNIKGLGESKTISRFTGWFLLVSYVGFIAYQVMLATGGSIGEGLIIAGMVVGGITFLGLIYRLISRRAIQRMQDGQPAITTRIICATRGGKDSQLTHQCAIRLATEQNAEVLFLYVFDLNALHRMATPIVINPEAQVKQMLHFLQTTAQGQAQQAGVPARVIVRTGSLIEQIRELAEEENASLVVLGASSENRGLFEERALASFAVEIERITGVTVHIAGMGDG